MKHYESRLQADLGAIRAAVEEIGDEVRRNIDDAVHGLITLDRDRMYDVILADHPVNRKTRALDAACHAFVARHIPAAGHLRFVSSVLRISIALERIGDYASTICRVGVHLDRPLESAMADDVRILADQASRMLEFAVRSFVRADSGLARDTARISRKVDRTHDRVFEELVSQGEGRTLMDVIRLQTVYDKLERVSDQAKNICEETLFVTTGESKPSKVYRVLFLDRDDAFLAPLAAALGRRAFPNSGTYSSAGLETGEGYEDALIDLAAQLDLDLGKPAPTALGPLRRYPAEYHVLVTLNLDAESVPELPFHTVLQRWEVDPLPTPDAPAGDLVRTLNDRLADLMETLRGEDAT